MTEKRLSIIVPCYKVEKYLPRCIESLVSQTLDGVEAIFVNDGSPDHCLDILKIYQEYFPEIIVIIDKENEGATKARQDAIRIAQGEYIGFVDSDDYVDVRFAEELYTAAKRADADMAVCGFKRIDLLTDKVLSQEMCTPRPTFTTQADAGRIVELNGAPWNKIIKADILKNVRGLDNPPRIFDDITFQLLVCSRLKGPVTFVPKSLVNYIVRSDSIMGTISTTHVQETLEAFRLVRERYVAEAASPTMLQALDTAAFLHLGISLIFRLSYDESLDIDAQLNMHLNYLDKHFPTWRESPYITLNYARTRGGAFWKLLFARWATDLGLIPPLLALYRSVLSTFAIDIKW